MRMFAVLYRNTPAYTRCSTTITKYIDDYRKISPKGASLACRAGFDTGVHSQGLFGA